MEALITIATVFPHTLAPLSKRQKQIFFVPTVFNAAKNAYTFLINKFIAFYLHLNSS